MHQYTSINIHSVSTSALVDKELVYFSVKLLHLFGACHWGQGPDPQSGRRVMSYQNYIVYHRLTNVVVLRMLCRSDPRLQAVKKTTNLNF